MKMELFSTYSAGCSSGAPSLSQSVRSFALGSNFCFAIGAPYLGSSPNTLLYAWGTNTNGQLTGSGSNAAVRPAGTVIANTSFRYISAGMNHSLGVVLEGTNAKKVVVWGENSNSKVTDIPSEVTNGTVLNVTAFNQTSVAIIAP